MEHKYSLLSEWCLVIIDHLGTHKPIDTITWAFSASKYCSTRMTIQRRVKFFLDTEMLDSVEVHQVG